MMMMTMMVVMTMMMPRKSAQDSWWATEIVIRWCQEVDDNDQDNLHENENDSDDLISTQDSFKTRTVEDFSWSRVQLCRLHLGAVGVVYGINGMYW